LQFVIEHSDGIAKHYRISKEVLGRGSFGEVRKGTLKASKAVRAIKSISKRKGELAPIAKEMEILKAIDHPNLVMLLEIYENETEVYLVMELCTGGDLEGRLKKEGALEEVPARFVMQQILRAVAYLHSHSICHRDLKPANCLFTTSEGVHSSILKVSDLGVSCRFEVGEVLTHVAGTPTHMAPEVFNKHYDQACDLWSCGVILFQLLCCELPFKGRSKEDMIKNIRHGAVHFDAVKWVVVSQPAIDLTNALLTVSPRERCTTHAALCHNWMLQAVPKGECALPPHIIDNILKFRSLNKLKRAALHVFVSMLKDKHVRASRQAFLDLDSNGDGIVSAAEIQAALDKAPSGNNQASLLDSGTTLEDFTYTEFIAATFDRRLVHREDLCRAVFNCFDKNVDESISISELATGHLIGKMALDEITEALMEVDVNSDMAVDWNEFKKLMMS